LKKLEQAKQRDLLGGIDPVQFARAKLVQGLRSVAVKAFKIDCGAVITPEELVETEKPDRVHVPKDHTVFAFKLRRDIKERVFLIMFKNKPDGGLDVMERSCVWQDGVWANQ
jgi:hypothetical protein